MKGERKVAEESVVSRVPGGVDFVRVRVERPRENVRAGHMRQRHGFREEEDSASAAHKAGSLR